MLKRNQRQYLGILFEVWDSNQSWFWFVIDPHCEGGSIGAAASEMEAVRDACRSIDEMMCSYLPPCSADTAVPWNKPQGKDMTRTAAIAHAHEQLRSGDFLRELDRRVAYPTESQNANRADVLRAYLEKELMPAFAELDSQRDDHRIALAH